MNLFVSKSAKVIARTIWEHRQTFLFSAIAIALSLATAFHRIYFSDFYPMDGDFQNFNIYRRVLNGQTPYVDFSNYLGMGVIAIHAPLLIAFQDDFTSSVFFTNFTTFLFFTFSIFIYLRASNVSREASCIISAIIPAAILLIPSIAKISPYVYMPGASMRMIRSFLPFGIAGSIMLWKKYKQVNDEHLLDSISKTKNITLLGLGFGLAFTWSNDYGTSCLAAGGIYIFLIQFFWAKATLAQVLKRMFLYSAAATVGALLSMTIATKGNPAAFILETLGIAKYQFWYFYDTKLLQIKDLRWFGYIFRIFVIINAWILLQSILQLKRRQITQNQITKGFIATSMLIAFALYALGSGGIFDSTSQLFVFAFAISLICKLATKLFRKHNHNQSHIIDYCLVILLTLASFLLLIEFRHSKFRDPYSLISTDQDWHNPSPIAMPNLRNSAPEQPVYIPELGGYTHYGSSLRNAKNLLGDNAIFSTYASALEVMLGQYQPTGYDYIIHALGDSSRQRYLKEFIQGNYQYSQTIRDEFSTYEPWVQRANWFFYRELYKIYLPEALTSYSVIWKRSSSINLIPNDCYSIAKRDPKNHSTSIDVRCNDSISGIADMEVSYQLEKKRNLSGILTVRTLVAVTDTTMSRFNKTAFCEYFIPNKSNSYRIPIVVANGEGHISIEGRPLDATELHFDTAKIISLLPDFPKKIMTLHSVL